MLLTKVVTRSKLGLVLAVAIFLLTLSEIVLRATGLTSFPVFLVDPSLGYLPVPNQSGRFLDRNRWSFNDRSMATAAPWNSALNSNLLLIGNSIVEGGNPIDQDDRLGTMLQADLGRSFAVWPIAAGGWSNLNEVNYLKRFDDVSRASDFFVWEYMAGGLSEVSKWRGKYLNPTSHPWFATWYVARRYMLPRFIDFGESELPPTGGVTQENLSSFEAMLAQLSTHSKFAVPGVIFLYPESCRLIIARQGLEWLPERRQIEAIAARHGIMVVDIARDPSWNSSLYRDPTHPTPAGNQVLGRILSEAVRNTAPRKQPLVEPVGQKPAAGANASAAAASVQADEKAASTC